MSERARRRRALFVWGYRRAAGTGLCLYALLLSTSLLGADCAPARIDERATVEYVHDGDSVTLTDGRKLRLIGINAPELPREDEAGQPLAVAARDALRSLLVGHREIGLRFGRERYDHYHRLLVHAYTRGGVSVQTRMLEGGYAAAIVVPPNTWGSECYRRAERRARDNGLGIWSLPYYRPLPSRLVESGESGFRFVTGRVERVGKSRRSIWLNLEGDVALRIARTDLQYFEPGVLERLQGRVVVARGWLIPRRDGVVMQVRHPFSLRTGAPSGQASRRP